MANICEICGKRQGADSANNELQLLQDILYLCEDCMKERQLSGDIDSLNG